MATAQAADARTVAHRLGALHQRIQQDPQGIVALIGADGHGDCRFLTDAHDGLTFDRTAAEWSSTQRQSLRWSA